MLNDPTKDHRAMNGEHTAGAASTSAKSPPEGALTWGSAAERKHLLKLWRSAVLRTISNGSQLKLAWILRDAVTSKGFAYMGDSYLKDEMACARNTVQVSFSDLEKVGAIIRTKGSERRVYLAKAIVERVLGCNIRHYTEAVTPPITPLCVIPPITHNRTTARPRRDTQFQAAKRAANLTSGAVTKTARELLDEQYGSTPLVDSQPALPLDVVVALQPIELALPPTRTPQKRRHFLPDDFRLSDAMVTKGEEVAGWDFERCRLEFQKFRAHYRSTGDKYFDWVETWTKWVIRGAEYDKEKRAKSNDAGKPSFVDLALSYREGRQ